ncbi:hypothetical protein PHISCL_05098 [Aspergillus sclerotialis]|uniref:Uncharacterized protein n=1 Tax=Aspergillus sclerotialis TaxID=2070753 RepID=A0A3A2ZHG9_9EURO|nr:hypothetical protein PHISCL_05098 [Aspergillus sclerotialis]
MADRHPSSNASSNDVSSNNTTSNNTSSNNDSSNRTEATSRSPINGRVGGQMPRSSQNEESGGRISDDPDSRTQEQVQYYQTFLQRFLGVVGSSDETTVERIVSLIRSGASQQEVLAALSQHTGGNHRAGQGQDNRRENVNWRG